MIDTVYLKVLGFIAIIYYLSRFINWLDTLNGPVFRNMDFEVRVMGNSTNHKLIGAYCLGSEFWCIYQDAEGKVFESLEKVYDGGCVDSNPDRRVEFRQAIERLIKDSKLEDKNHG